MIKKYNVKVLLIVNSSINTSIDYTIQCSSDDTQ